MARSTTAKSMPAAVRLANNLSNGEIISFADELTATGNGARKDLQVVKTRQDFSRIMWSADDLPNRLLHDRLLARISLNLHGQKVCVPFPMGQCSRRPRQECYFACPTSIGGAPTASRSGIAFISFFH